MEREFVIAVPSGLLFGTICALVAAGRGRNGLVWFALGFVFQCFGLIFLLVLPDLRLEEQEHQQLVSDNRRLRERIHRDRQVAARRHEATHRRLDAHDRALNIDTSHLLGNEERGTLASPELLATFERALWFYLVDRDQVGPVAFAELKRVWREGGIGPTTHVWRDGMADWQRVGELRELEAELRA